MPFSNEHNRDRASPGGHTTHKLRPQGKSFAARIAWDSRAHQPFWVLSAAPAAMGWSRIPMGSDEIGRSLKRDKGTCNVSFHSC
jgi:hypothetical protein